MKRKYNYSVKKIKKEGKINGRAWKWVFWPFHKKEYPVRPAIDQVETDHFEAELIKLGSELLIDNEKNWLKEDRQLKATYCKAMVELNNAKDKLDEETEDLHEEEERFNKASETLNLFDLPDLSKFWEIFWLVFLASTEILMNYKIFSILGASLYETLIMGIGISAVLTVVAYFIGSTLKKEPMLLKDKINVLVLFIAVLGGLFVIALLRSNLFEYINENQAIHFNISPFELSLIFIGLNLLLFLASTGITYKASHSQPKKYKRALSQYELTKNNFEKANEDFKDAVERYENAKMNFENLKQKRLKRHQYYHSNAVDIIENTEWHISVYRTANIKYRKDGSIPPCFKKDNHDLRIPFSLELDNLDWECTDFTHKII